MPHEYCVKTMLNAEEFVAFRALCDSLGISQSSRIRMMIREDIRRSAERMSGSMDSEHSGPILGQDPRRKDV